LPSVTSSLIYLVYSNPAKQQALETAIASEQLPVTIMLMDVDSDDSVARAIGAIQRDHGPIDVLVNNAGIEHTGSVEEIPLADFRRVMETNYFGALRAIQAVVPGMRERRGGCIINVAPVAGKIASSPFGPYTASKFALEAFSEVLAQEMAAFDVRVAIVEPGIIDTPMARRLEEDGAPSRYPQSERFAALFTASLEQPVPPAMVAAKMLEIAESGTRQLRHPVGPDTEPFLRWRAAMPDEEWVALGATVDDEVWYERIERDFGHNARPRAQRVGTA